VQVKYGTIKIFRIVTGNLYELQPDVKMLSEGRRSLRGSVKYNKLRITGFMDSVHCPEI
jgi:hypothetical protein